MDNLHGTMEGTRKLRALAVLMCICAMVPTSISRAQEVLADKPPMTAIERHTRMATAPTQTFYLKYESDPAGGNEILTAIRNVLDPDVKVYLVPGQRAIVVKGLPDDLAEVMKLLGELDRPKDTYRLTYTVREYDGTRQASTARYVMTVQDGQVMTLKQGNRVPIVTGKTSSDPPELQMAYNDVGMTFDSVPSAVAGGANLKFDVVQSSVPNPVPAGQDPVIQQTELKGTTMVPLGKPTSLGSLDIPSTTHHLEVEVLLEKLP